LNYLLRQYLIRRLITYIIILWKQGFASTRKFIIIHRLTFMNLVWIILICWRILKVDILSSLFAGYTSFIIGAWLVDRRPATPCRSIAGGDNTSRRRLTWQGWACERGGNTNEGGKWWLLFRPAPPCIKPLVSCRA
jgi:hypothetical protein